MKIVNITDRISYIGVNDRKTSLFENNWSLPHGMAYNSYLINDDKTVLVDTVKYGSDNEYIAKIKKVLGGKPLDYIAVNHMEPDHAGMIGVIMNMYPDCKIIGNVQTKKMINDYFGIGEDRFKMVADGEEIPIGQSTLKFIYIPWVHWPETMVTYDVKDQVIFTCDAFGGYGALDGGIFDSDYDWDKVYLDDMRRYYSNIVCKYSTMVLKALAKLDGVPINVIAPSHGVVWKENPMKVVGLFKDWAEFKAEEGVVIAFATMYGHTETLADMIGQKLCDAGVKNIITYNVSNTNISFILSDIQKYKGYILGTCAYNGVMHPAMQHLCNEIKITNQKNKVVGLFGTSSWNGAGVKDLKKFAEENKIAPVEPAVETFGDPTPEKVESQIDAFVKAYSAALK